jgi:dTDP-glucose 4,6-dehydratase
MLDTAGIDTKPSQIETCLVTGGAGFIGSCLVRQLLMRGNTRVVTLDKLTYAGNLSRLANFLELPEHAFERCDIQDRAAVLRILQTYRPQKVYHLAAESHVDRSIDGPDEFVKTNVLGTFELLEACRAYWLQLDDPDQAQFRFLHISTDEVYGSLGPTGSFREDSPYAPNSPYSASKAASDHFVRAYHATYGFPAMITHSSNNYGPHQATEKLIPLMILNAWEGKPLPVYGDGGNIRDWLHVDDHCRALRLIMDRGTLGAAYNIGGDCERTNLELVRNICDAVDRFDPELPHRPCSSLITFVADRPGHDRRYAVDSSRLKEELAWRPQRSLESGMQDTVQWFLENASTVAASPSGSCHRERLGLATGKGKW